MPRNRVLSGSPVREALVLFSLLYAGSVVGEELADIPNFLAYSDALASAGQPTEAQLAEAAEQGYTRVINLGFSGSESAPVAEDKTVVSEGMRFIHIPVDWRAPKVDDFRTFAAVMQAEPDARTLVHCQLNYRASAFSYLYRVAILGEPEADARRDMQSIWTPNETWSAFIQDTLAAYE